METSQSTESVAEKPKSNTARDPEYKTEYEAKPGDVMNEKDEATVDEVVMETDAKAGAGASDAVAPHGLETKVSELEAQLKEKDSKVLYLYAEFENFKKRAQKEKLDWQRFGWEPIAAEMVLVLDNLERAIQHAPAGDANLTLGLQMVIKQFYGALEKGGVSPVSAQGVAFDPNLHEAVSQEASEQPQGQVIRELAKGFMLHGRLLRPARVVVSSGQASG